MVTLVILDGFGIAKKGAGNAITLAGTPNLDKLKKVFPHTSLKASGTSVGLSEGQMGNSEVGHLNLGAGRVVLQDLERINKAIETKAFFENKVFLEAFEHVKQNSSKLHLMGLVSNGGVHSHIAHLKALIDMARKNGIEEVFVHAFTDGRDTDRMSGKRFVAEVEDYLEGKGKVASICGRVYAMDREKRYERVMKAYDALALGRAEEYFPSSAEAFDYYYSKGIYDEFLEPTIIGKPVTIGSGDAVIFFNFRTDRPRELTEAFTQKGFDKFPLKKLSNLYFVTMTEYSKDLNNVFVAFPPEEIKNTLAEVISAARLKQFHTSETTKYAHVTFFFNGGKEAPCAGEDRKLIESIDTLDFSEYPEMRAYDITTTALEAIASGKYDFVLLNLSNPDMIGHTANIEATVKAIKCVDKCAYAIATATLLAGGDCIITADHGNAEELLRDGKPNTAHTTNPVPFILVSDKFRKAKLLSGGKLANVAPTVLQLLGLTPPPEMEKSLIK